MTPEAEAIGRAAHVRQLDHATVPDRTIRRELANVGVAGDFGDAEFREAYLECEREWLRLHRESVRPGRCGNCGTPTSKQGAKLCRRCWRERAEWAA